MVTGNLALLPAPVGGGDTGEVGQRNEPGPSPMALSEGLAERDTRSLAMSPRPQGGMLTPYLRAATSVHSADRDPVSHDPPMA